MFFGKKVGKMADIHCHILPGIDDGAADIEESLKMLRIAASEGITEIVLTPHFKPVNNNASISTINRLIRELQKNIDKERLDITLYPGNEILFFEDVLDLIEKEDIYSLNGGKRVLIEFLPSIGFNEIKEALESVLTIGYIPILAHAERYSCLLKDRKKVDILKDIGVEIQINVSSVEGIWGALPQKFTLALLEDELVDYMGTDAHSTGRRAPRYAKCYKKLSKILDRDYLEHIFYYNALENIIIS